MPHDDLLAQPADTEFLGYRYVDGQSIGYIESVNGGQSVGCPEFEATKFELLLIAKYWYRRFAELQRLDQIPDATTDLDWRTAIYAKRRVDRIRHHLGDKLVDEVIAEVDAELSADDPPFPTINTVDSLD